MKTWTVVDTNIAHFKGCTLPLELESFAVGDTVELLGSRLTITQKGSSVVALTNKTQVFVLQELVHQD